MARYMAGVLTGAGSTTLPIISLYAGSAISPKVREIGVFNTTNTAVALKLCRISTAGTASAISTIVKYDPASATNGCTPYQTHSSTPPTITDGGYRTVLGAAAGSGVIWTFGDTGVVVATGTGNGFGVVVENGTGQICQAYIVWDE